jgi:hypothetical protein
MAAIVHGHSGFVEKSNEVVSQQMVLNKLFIPDVLIDIIKDYLYISAAEVLRKFYRSNVNNSITSLWVDYTTLTDIYGRDRQCHFGVGHVYGSEKVQLQGMVCVTCGDFDHFHNNMNGCCSQEFDLEDEPIQLVENFWEEPSHVTDLAEDAESETIPEVTWEIDIPVASQGHESVGWRSESDDGWETDEETRMADRAEYEYEIRLERFNSRR